MAKTSAPELTLWSISLIIAPLFLATASFFWHNDGGVGINGGTLQVLSFVFWVPAFMGLFNLLKEKMPAYATWGFLLAVYGSIAGNNFGMDGIYSEVFQIDNNRLQNAIREYPLHFNLILFLPGALFPLSMLLLGINLLRKKAVPAWVAVLLCAGAVAFPASRIPRIEMLAHMADILLAVPLVYIGFNFRKYTATR